MVEVVICAWGEIDTVTPAQELGVPRKASDAIGGVAALSAVRTAGPTLCGGAVESNESAILASHVWVEALALAGVASGTRVSGLLAVFAVRSALEAASSGFSRKAIVAYAARRVRRKVRR